MALAAKQRGGTRLSCVDLFPAREDWRQNRDGSWSFTAGGVDAYVSQTVWNEPYQRDIAPLYEKNDSVLDIFLNSLKRYEVEDVVRWHKGNVASFGRAGEEMNYTLAFIDGDHGEEAVRHDIEFALSRMPGGGWLCFDDAFGFYGGVDNAIREYLWPNRRTLFGQQLTRKFHAVRIGF